MFKNFISNESGATAIEYAVMASLLSVAVIAALTNVSARMQNVFYEVSTALK